MWPFRKESPGRGVAEPRAQKKRVLSFLSPQETEALGGIPIQAVVGEFVGEEGDPSVESFRPNPVFTAFLHETIRRWGPRDAELRAAARDQGNGWIYIIDLRTPEGPQGRVPPEDIIGGFQVAAGEIVVESYRSLPTHRVYTRNGMCQLPESLREALVRRLPSVR